MTELPIFAYGGAAALLGAMILSVTLTIFIFWVPSSLF
jgi:hypothetical protein